MTFLAKHSSKSSVALSKPTLDGNYCYYYNKKYKNLLILVALTRAEGAGKQDQAGGVIFSGR